eukprot:CAMPEP_0201544404 /NCGR_PEP_ID=MMETSP0173_2-20130828/1012_1 /ASSEMBLY_ACC=CAM_ASM_000268 /TAXON_ID=218659 /ORGANISM="Vexillifera sp., Strain DIVA3 564/2" /LENGTH=278 /DNA_ID=CAMNT_0047952503 /DNA_START=307 /DNA_END=1140 /DNA_ORIENTATION=-
MLDIYKQEKQSLAETTTNDTSASSTAEYQILGQEYFDDFYEDVLDELERHGEVEEMIVCNNFNDHLIGNVYVKFRDETSAERALHATKDRFYKGKKVVCEFSPVLDFRESRCWEFEQNRCSRGDFCNFMHLKRVSDDRFADLFPHQIQHRPKSPPPGHRGSHHYRSSYTTSSSRVDPPRRRRRSRRHRYTPSPPPSAGYRSPPPIYERSRHKSSRRDYPDDYYYDSPPPRGGSRRDYDERRRDYDERRRDYDERRRDYDERGGSRRDYDERRRDYDER